MSIKDEWSAVARTAREEAVVFFEKFRLAAIGGAQTIGEQIRDSAEELLPPSTSVVTDRVKAAIQSGATVVGEQVMAAGLEFVEALKSASRK